MVAVCTPNSSNEPSLNACPQSAVERKAPRSVGQLGGEGETTRVSGANLMPGVPFLKQLAKRAARQC